jgi:hypothetical protein
VLAERAGRLRRLEVAGSALLTMVPARNASDKNDDRQGALGAALAGRRMLRSPFDETKEEVYWPGYLTRQNDISIVY